MPIGGYFLRAVLGDSPTNSLYVLTPVALVYVINSWRGNAANQLLLSLAERMDETKDDAIVGCN